MASFPIDLWMHCGLMSAIQLVPLMICAFGTNVCLCQSLYAMLLLIRMCIVESCYYQIILLVLERISIFRASIFLSGTSEYREDQQSIQHYVGTSINFSSISRGRAKIFRASMSEHQAARCSIQHYILYFL